MKRLLKVTYWVCFDGNKNSKHHCTEQFYFWKAPVFLEWMVENREKIEKENNCSLVVTSLGKL